MAAGGARHIGRLAAGGVAAGIAVGAAYSTHRLHALRAHTAFERHDGGLVRLSRWDRLLLRAFASADELGVASTAASRRAAAADGALRLLLARLQTEAAAGPGRDTEELRAVLAGLLAFSLDENPLPGSATSPAGALWASMGPLEWATLARLQLQQPSQAPAAAAAQDAGGAVDVATLARRLACRLLARSKPAAGAAETLPPGLRLPPGAIEFVSAQWRGAAGSSLSLGGVSASTPDRATADAGAQSRPVPLLEHLRLAALALRADGSAIASVHDAAASLARVAASDTSTGGGCVDALAMAACGMDALAAAAASLPEPGCLPTVGSSRELVRSWRDAATTALRAAVPAGCVAMESAAVAAAVEAKTQQAPSGAAAARAKMLQQLTRSYVGLLSTVPRSLQATRQVVQQPPVVGDGAPMESFDPGSAGARLHMRLPSALLAAAAAMLLPAGAAGDDANRAGDVTALAAQCLRACGDSVACDSQDPSRYAYLRACVPLLHALWLTFSPEMLMPKQSPAQRPAHEQELLHAAALHALEALLSPASATGNGSQGAPSELLPLLLLRPAASAVQASVSEASAFALSSLPRSMAMPHLMSAATTHGVKLADVALACAGAGQAACAAAGVSTRKLADTPTSPDTAGATSVLQGLTSFCDQASSRIPRFQVVSQLAGSSSAERRGVDDDDGSFSASSSAAAVLFEDEHGMPVSATTGVKEQAGLINPSAAVRGQLHAAYDKTTAATTQTFGDLPAVWGVALPDDAAGAGLLTSRRSASNAAVAFNGVPQPVKAVVAAITEARGAATPATSSAATLQGIKLPDGRPAAVAQLQLPSLLDVTLQLTRRDDSPEAQARAVGFLAAVVSPSAPSASRVAAAMHTNQQSVARLLIAQAWVLSAWHHVLSAAATKQHASRPAPAAALPPRRSGPNTPTVPVHPMPVAASMYRELLRWLPRHIGTAALAAGAPPLEQRRVDVVHSAAAVLAADGDAGAVEPQQHGEDAAASAGENGSQGAAGPGSSSTAVNAPRLTHALPAESLEHPCARLPPYVLRTASAAARSIRDADVAPATIPLSPLSELFFPAFVPSSALRIHALKALAFVAAHEETTHTQQSITTALSTMDATAVNGAAVADASAPLGLTRAETAAALAAQGLHHAVRCIADHEAAAVTAWRDAVAPSPAGKVGHPPVALMEWRPFRDAVAVLRQCARLTANLAEAATLSPQSTAGASAQLVQSCDPLVSAVCSGAAGDSKLRCHLHRALANARAMEVSPRTRGTGSASSSVPATYGDMLFPLVDSALGAANSSVPGAGAATGLDIVLVHGLQGAALKTWRLPAVDPLTDVQQLAPSVPVPAAGGLPADFDVYVLKHGQRMALWPAYWLARALLEQPTVQQQMPPTAQPPPAPPSVRIIAAAYDADMWSGGILRPQRTLPDIGTELLDQLVRAGVGQQGRRVLFIPHSMVSSGGTPVTKCGRAPASAGSCSFAFLYRHCMPLVAGRPRDEAGAAAGGNERRRGRAGTGRRHDRRRILCNAPPRQRHR